MQSKRSQEGYLLIDHSCGDGLDPAGVRALSPELPAGAGRGVFETPTYTCSHCQTVVILNPLRTRERAYCPKCDHYLCDNCGAVRKANGGECKTFKQVIEEIKEAAAKSELIREV